MNGENRFYYFRKRISRNKELSDEFSMNSVDHCLKIEDNLDELKKICVKQLATLNSCSKKAAGLFLSISFNIGV